MPCSHGVCTATDFNWRIQAEALYSGPGGEWFLKHQSTATHRCSFIIAGERHFINLFSRGNPHIAGTERSRGQMDFDYVVLPAVILVAALLLVWLCIRRMRAISAKDHRLWRKGAERAVLSFIVLLAILLGGSCSLNAIKLYRFRSTNPPPGSFYSVYGRKMRISCTGSGSPAIILEAGSGGDGLVWGGVQTVLSKTTRVCSYDRAGLGWSEPRPGTRDADHIAGELHELLRQANVTGPFVLMGHSVAGLYMRDYVSHYPTDVAGIIFVDSVLPSPSRNSGPNVPLIMAVAMRPVFILGIPRLTGACSHPKPGFDASTGMLQREDVCHTEYGTCLHELEGRDRSDQQTANTGPYGDLPVLILSHDPAQNGVVSDQAQEELKKLSSRSRRVIAKGSGHYVMFDRPDLIEREVPLLVGQIRGTAPWAPHLDSHPSNRRLTRVTQAMMLTPPSIYMVSPVTRLA